jgi:branched-chain amino acid aminotransferase
MGLKVWLNGQLVDEEDARVSVWDHGFLYGDGVFEGIRAYNGRVFKLTEHIDRLYASARAIYLEIPLSWDGVRDAILETLRANKMHESYIRVVCSRGKGDLGIDPNNCSDPTFVVIAAPLKLYPQELYDTGLEVITVATRRNPPHCIDPRIKSLNYLNNILAKVEVIRQGLKEGIMLTTDGFVAEATADNVFVIKDGNVLTPPSHLGALCGITRATVMELASDLGYRVEEAPLTQYDLYNCDECFLTGTGAEVISVVKIDGRTIGDGKPGPHTNKLLKAFREYAAQQGDPIYEEVEVPA